MTDYPEGVWLEPHMDGSVTVWRGPPPDLKANPVKYLELLEPDDPADESTEAPSP